MLSFIVLIILAIDKWRNPYALATDPGIMVALASVDLFLLYLVEQMISS